MTTKKNNVVVVLCLNVIFIIINWIITGLVCDLKYGANFREAVPVSVRILPLRYEYKSFAAHI